MTPLTFKYLALAFLAHRTMTKPSKGGLVKISGPSGESTSRYSRAARPKMRKAKPRHSRS